MLADGRQYFSDCCRWESVLQLSDGESARQSLAVDQLGRAITAMEEALTLLDDVNLAIPAAHLDLAIEMARLHWIGAPSRPTRPLGD